MNSVGVNPYSSSKTSLVYFFEFFPPVFTMSTVVLSLANCKASLSPVTIIGIYPASSASFDMVPNKSSASNPAISSIFTFMADNTSFKIGICIANSLSIGFLPALYSLYASCLNVGAFTSKVTPINPGLYSFLNFASILRKPYTPVVCSPSFVIIGGLIPK